MGIGWDLLATMKEMERLVDWGPQTELKNIVAHRSFNFVSHLE